jgi:hypothetical protein
MRVRRVRHIGKEQNGGAERNRLMPFRNMPDRSGDDLRRLPSAAEDSMLETLIHGFNRG